MIHDHIFALYIALFYCEDMEYFGSYNLYIIKFLLFYSKFSSTHICQTAKFYAPKFFWGTWRSAITLPNH